MHRTSGFSCCYLYLRFRQEGTLPLRACPCFLGLFFAGGAKGVDVGLVVQGFFGCGGGDYGKQQDKLGAGAAAGVRVEPMAFLVVKDGVTRMLPVGTPAITTVDRIVEMVPDLMDKVEKYFDKKKEEETC